MMMSYKKTFSWKHTREKKKELGKEKFLMQKAKLDMTNSGLGDIQKRWYLEGSDNKWFEFEMD